MNIDAKALKKAKAVLAYFESGAINSYSQVSIYKDSKSGGFQITYGVLQTTQDYGLKTLLTNYVRAGGEWADKIKPYLNRLKEKNLHEDEFFLQLLRIAGKEQLMQDVQDAFFQKNYFEKARKWSEDNGFTLPLSFLVIADSFIHSGGIRMDIREMFSAVPPAKGGEEKKWIIQYVKAREKWLSTRAYAPLRLTTYRTATFKAAIEQENWGLLAPIKANGKTIN